MLFVYNLLRYASILKSRRIKLLGIWLMHVLGRRYIGVFLDPVLARNLRCKMCYFSDAEKRKSYIRINYTINNDNLNELKLIWGIVGEDIDALQLRPIQKIGNSTYTD